MLKSKRHQRTIARDAEVRGIGFLTGADVRVRFRPGQPDTGVLFVRVDLPGQPSVPAHIRHVVPRQRRTTIQRDRATVEMIEHVMAALSGLHIDNCVVELDAPETPGLDGSSLAYVKALNEAGVVEQDRVRDRLVIDRPITVREGPATLTAHPGVDDRLVLSYNLDYGDHTPIGRQSLFVEISPESFCKELAPSRTFLLEAEAIALRQSGIGERTTVHDLLVFGPSGLIENTLRYPDECVRHKVLDLLGDLALLDQDIVGHVVAHRSGHQLNASLVRKLHKELERDLEKPARTSTAMSYGDISKRLPHRYPFLLVDRVLHVEEGRSIVAIKNVSCNEPFFQGHWPGRPIMPGVLILEALAQTAGIMISDTVNYREKVAMIVAMNDVKIRKQVVPGDQMRMTITIVRAKSRVIDVKAIATVDDQIAAEAEIRFMLVDATGVA